MPTTNTEGIPRGTQTLARGFDVLDAVANGASSVREVASVTGLSRSTAHRLCQMLTSRQCLVADAEAGLRLGPRMITYGYLAQTANPIHVVAKPIMLELAREQHDTVHLGARVGDEVLYLEKIDGQRGARMRSQIGGRMPLTRTALGMALLLDDPPDAWERMFRAQSSANSPKAVSSSSFVSTMRVYRRRGVTLDLEDNEVGIRCVAVPIRSVDGTIKASLSISATLPYMPDQRMAGLGVSLLRAAKVISRSIGAPQKTGGGTHLGASRPVDP